jgi:hypothetical protein
MTMAIELARRAIAINTGDAYPHLVLVACGKMIYRAVSLDKVGQNQRRAQHCISSDKATVGVGG